MLNRLKVGVKSVILGGASWIAVLTLSLFNVFI